MLAGRHDAAALSGVMAGFLSAVPWVAANPAALIPAMAAATVGASWLAHKTFRKHIDPVEMDKRSDFILPSDKLFGQSIGPGGLRLGYTADKNLPLDIDNDLATRHMMILGSTGVGKTVLGESMLYQQIVRGGGFLFIDAKLDKDTRDRLAWMASIHGRGDDFMVLNTSDPSNSNTYNPLISGDGAEIASRLLSLVPITEGNPGADHFKQMANTAVMSLTNALKSEGYRFHFGDLALLLQSPKAMNAVVGLARRGTPEERALQIWMDQFRIFTKGGGVSIDMKKVKENFGGIAGRIAQFAQGGFGDTFNCYTPDIDIVEAMRRNKLIYVMLPTLAKDQMAINIGKLLISDIRNAVAHMQDLPKSRRPDPPFLVFADEFGSYVTSSASTLVEQARSASVMMAIAFQSLGNLDTIGPDFKAKVLQNTWTKVFFRLSNVEDAEAAAEIIGKRAKFAVTYGTGSGSGESSPITRLAPDINESDQASASEGWREAEAHRISPDQLGGMNKGEAVVNVGSSMFHIRVPMITAPNEIPEFKVMRPKRDMPAKIKPLNFESRYAEFLTTENEERTKGNDS